MFVDPMAFRDKKAEVIRMIREFMDHFEIPTTRKIAGIYTVDLVRELAKELLDLPNARIDEGLEFLITRATEIRGGGSRGR